MLPGNTPALFGRGFLAPSQAYGNDSYTVSLLHFDAPDAQIGVAGQGFTDYAYGAPSRRNAWTVGGGAPATIVSYPFNQVGVFTNQSNSINCPDAPDLTPVGDFSFDFWIAYNGTGTNGEIINKRAPSGYGPFLFIQSSSYLVFYASSNGTTWDIANGVFVAGPGMGSGVWYHIAVTRQGSTGRTFLNGSASATFNSALPLWKNTYPLSIGAGGGGSLGAFWIDEFRFSNGIARWTAAFTPPNQPYYALLNGGNDAATKLLLHFDKDTFTSESAAGASSPHPVTNSGAGQLGSPQNTARTLNVAQFTSGTQRITIPGSAELNLYRGNFTVDFMYYRSANVSGGYIASKRSNATQFAPFVLYDNGTTGIQLLMSAVGSAWDINTVAASGIALNTWMHLALVRDGSTINFYVDGTRTFTQNIGLGTFFSNPSIDMSIGGHTDAPPSNCLIEEFRYSDVARWSGASFTAPVSGGLPYS